MLQPEPCSPCTTAAVPFPVQGRGTACASGTACGAACGTQAQTGCQWKYTVTPSRLDLGCRDTGNSSSRWHVRRHRVSSTAPVTPCGCAPALWQQSCRCTSRRDGCSVVECDCSDCLGMARVRSHGRAGGDLPQPSAHVRGSRDEVARVSRENTVPHPPTAARRGGEYEEELYNRLTLLTWCGPTRPRPVKR